MYFPDLSSYRYRGTEEPSTLNVGWLDGAHEYSKGTAPEGFIERLWIFCETSVRYMMGSQWVGGYRVRKSSSNSLTCPGRSIWTQWLALGMCSTRTFGTRA
jgi:hypothetical protein